MGHSIGSQQQAVMVLFLFCDADFIQITGKEAQKKQEC
jgi:hypothetical protein